MSKTWRIDPPHTAGDDFSLHVLYELPSAADPELLAPADLTGYTVRMRWLRRDGSAAYLFSSDPADPRQGTVVVGDRGDGSPPDPASGWCSFSLPAAAQSAMKDEDLVYDVRVVSPGGETTTLLEGVVPIKRRG